MSLIDKLERKLGFLAIHNLTVYLVVGQIGIFIMAAAKGSSIMGFLEFVMYSFDGFIDGKPWTIISFLLVPRHLEFSGMGFFWTIVSWLMLYSLGSQLERAWGAFRFTLFILISLLGIIVTSLFYQQTYMTNYYLLSSIWFAYFITFPDVPFFFGIKAKWIGVFLGVMTLLDFLAQQGVGRMLIAFSLINLPVFFGSEVLGYIRGKQRIQRLKAEKKRQETEPFHTCSVCGATDLSHPDRDFRYRKEGAICSDCLGDKSD
ncbi:rhomboid family intramembrane serine protease [Pelagicoccus mobilis]|uniref:Peptidase S54 rhomboid domain-containing protein n=1 Tax=Pelagicoccus mobilis TaxID=415221 RepID=A0A934VMP0_9BACT|nr:rhomboid family intramembrane serine protease [Pelagicoccus mobilis]MBK1879051.1 hypothetical protein [Pelagicoccus mobilis]